MNSDKAKLKRIEDRRMMSYDIGERNNLPKVVKFIDSLLDGNVSQIIQKIDNQVLRTRLFKSLENLKSLYDANPKLIDDTQIDLIKRVFARCMYSKQGIGLQDPNSVSLLTNHLTDKLEEETSTPGSMRSILERAIFHALHEADELIDYYITEEDNNAKLARKNNFGGNFQIPQIDINIQFPKLGRKSIITAAVSLALLASTQLGNVLDNIKASQPKPNIDTPTEVEKNPTKAINNSKNLTQLQKNLDRHLKDAKIMLNTGADTDYSRSVVIKTDTPLDITKLSVDGVEIDLTQVIRRILQQDDKTDWILGIQKTENGWIINISAPQVNIK
jgi:hypothetical protein